MQKPASIYIHIPFCLKKCLYCDFSSFACDQTSIELYLGKLCCEIKWGLEAYSINSIKSLYIGGGTPSLVSIDQIEKILSPIQNLNGFSESENTIEVNPATGNREYFEDLRDAGMNRISIGAQSFDDDLLKILGRPHCSKDIYNTIEAIQAAGIGNISIDLMYGLPVQSISLWQKTLAEAIKLPITHISAYGLKLESGTPFHKKYFPDHPDIPTDEMAETMFMLARKKLSSAGFEHYEISNYAKKGYECRHNLNYWHNKDYFGFGLAAHSFINRKRIENTTKFENYLDEPATYRISRSINEKEFFEDEIFLRLRTGDGIDLEKFRKTSHINFLVHYQSIIKKYENFFIQQNGKICLSPRGMLLSNIILSEFIS